MPENPSGTSPGNPEESRPQDTRSLQESLDTQLLVLFAKTIQEINRKLSAGMGSEQILDFIFDTLGVLIPFDRMSIATLDEGSKTLRLNWVRSKIPIQTLKQNYASPLTASLEKIIQTGEPRIISDLVKYAAEHPQSKATKLIISDGIRSNLTYPLRTGDKPVGVVFFSSREPHTYDKDHIEIFRGIADEVSIIISQGKLTKLFADRASSAQTLRMTLHDLRAPLGVIQGFINLATEEDWYQDLSEDAKEIFGVIEKNAGYLLDLVNQLSEFNQIAHGISKIEPHPLRLDEFIKDVVTYGQILCEQKDIDFEAKIAAELPMTANFDLEKIRRVLDNLFSNAIKFSQRGTKVTFSVKQVNDRIEFSVADHGVGIPEDEFPKLFKEFGKTSAHPTEGESSSGLGLAIAKRIIDLHGGEITFHSKPGKGSTFMFSLPLVRADLH